MKTQDLYNRATTNGCEFECTCVDIDKNKWDELMKGSKRADRKLVVKIALLAGVIEREQAKTELRKPYFNPYNHYKTTTHAIYVHSSIEHFIKIY